MKYRALMTRLSDIPEASAEMEVSREPTLIGESSNFLDN